MLLNVPEEYKDHPLGILAKEYEDEIKKNYDDRKKIVGDRILVWNISGCFDEFSRPLEDEEIIRQEMIVIETDIEDVSLNFIFLGEEYVMKLDLLLYNPADLKKYRANSELCKII